MNHTRTICCTGCHRRCPQGAPRCGRGRAYFEKLEQERAASGRGETVYAVSEVKPVAKGGLAAKLIAVSRNAKMAIQNQHMPEEEFFSALTAEERKTLFGLLKKLDFRGSLVG